MEESLLWMKVETNVRRVAAGTAVLQGGSNVRLTAKMQKGLSQAQFAENFHLPNPSLLPLRQNGVEPSLLWAKASLISSFCHLAPFNLLLSPPSSSLPSLFSFFFRF
jgi:hypothetical protein